MKKYLYFFLVLLFCGCSLIKVNEINYVKLYSPIPSGSYTCNNLLKDSNNNFYINGTFRKSKKEKIKGWWAYTLSADSLGMPRWFSVDSLKNTNKSFSNCSTIINNNLVSCVSSENNNNWLITRNLNGDNKKLTNIKFTLIDDFLKDENKTIFYGTNKLNPCWGTIDNLNIKKINKVKSVNGKILSACKSNRSGYYFVAVSYNKPYNLYIIKANKNLKYMWHRSIANLGFMCEKIFLLQLKNGKLKLYIPSSQNGNTIAITVSETAREPKISSINYFIEDFKNNIFRTNKGFYKLSAGNMYKICNLWGVGSGSGKNSFVYLNNKLAYTRPIAEQWNMFIGLMFNANKATKPAYFGKTNKPPEN